MIPAARGHLLCWRSSTLYTGVAAPLFSGSIPTAELERFREQSYRILETLQIPYGGGQTCGFP